MPKRVRNYKSKGDTYSKLQLAKGCDSRLWKEADLQKEAGITRSTEVPGPRELALLGPHLHLLMLRD